MSSDFESKNANNIAGQNNDSSESSPANPLDRRHFLVGAAAGAAAMALPRWARADTIDSSPNLGLTASQDDLTPIRAEITKRHDESMQRMHNWIKQPSIAAAD